MRPARAVRPSRPATRAAVVVALRGSHGVRVTTHRAPVTAPRPAGAAPQFTAAPAPASAPAPAVAVAAEAPAPAAAQPAPAEPAAGVTPAAPAAETSAAPRDEDHGGDGGDREDVRPPDLDDEED
jgi:hypothetical protein